MYGKWKEFYFVLNFTDQKLLYYDHDTVSMPVYMYFYVVYYITCVTKYSINVSIFVYMQSHRARGLLDLRQCRVYTVHPSLFGRYMYPHVYD